MALETFELQLKFIFLIVFHISIKQFKLRLLLNVFLCEADPQHLLQFLSSLLHL